MDLIFSRYELAEVLGQGAMGVVWRAHDTLLDRDIALKELRPGPGVDPAEALDRFLVEARAAARLNHPNIVGIHDVLSDGERVLIAMELVDAPTLDVVLAASGPQPAPIVRAVMAQVAQALAAAHNAGVIHRDLKPQNIFWTADGRAVVADFGLARIGSGGGTVAGAVMGTPGYMAPEQVRGAATGTGADVFGWGVVAYELAAGRAAFGDPESDPMALAYRIVHDSPAPLELAADPGLAALIASALEKEPGRRPADGGALVRELIGPVGVTDQIGTTTERFAETGGLVEETQLGSSPEVGPRARHRRLIVAAVVAVAVLVVVGTVGIAENGGSHQADGDTTGAVAAQSATAPIPIDDAAIAGGTYRSNSFQPSFTLTLSANWAGEYESDGLLELARPDLQQPGDLLSTVTFIQLRYVFDPTRSYDDQASYADPSALQKAPADVFAWLCGHPRLVHPCSYVPDELAGTPITRLDVMVQDGYRSEGCNAPGTPCVFAFYDPDLETRYVLYAGMEYGFYLYHVRNAPVLMAIEAPVSSFAAFVPTAKTILATVRFDEP